MGRPGQSEHGKIHEDPHAAYLQLHAAPVMNKGGQARGSGQVRGSAAGASGQVSDARNIFARLHDTGGYKIPDVRGSLHEVTFKNEHGVHEAVARGEHMYHAGVADHWALKDHKTFETVFQGHHSANTTRPFHSEDSYQSPHNEEMDEFMVLMENQRRQLKEWEANLRHANGGGPSNQALKELLATQSKQLEIAQASARRSRSQSPTRSTKRQSRHEYADNRGVHCRSTSLERWRRTKIRAQVAQQQVKPLCMLKNRKLLAINGAQCSRWERLAVQALGREDLLREYDAEEEDHGGSWRRGQLVTQAVVEEFTNLGQGSYRKADIYWAKAMNELGHVMPGAAEVAKGAQGIHSMMTHEQMLQMLPFDALRPSSSKQRTGMLETEASSDYYEHGYENHEQMEGDFHLHPSIQQEPPKSVRGKSPAERTDLLHRRKSLAPPGSGRRSLQPHSGVHPGGSHHRHSRHARPSHADSEHFGYANNEDANHDAKEVFSKHIDDIMEAIAQNHGPSTQQQPVSFFPDKYKSNGTASSSTRMPASPKSPTSPASSGPDYWSNGHSPQQFSARMAGAHGHHRY